MGAAVDEVAEHDEDMAAMRMAGGPAFHLVQQGLEEIEMAMHVADRRDGHARRDTRRIGEGRRGIHPSLITIRSAPG